MEVLGRCATILHLLAKDPPRLLIAMPEGAMRNDQGRTFAQTHQTDTSREMGDNAFFRSSYLNHIISTFVYVLQQHFL